MIFLNRSWLLVIRADTLAVHLSRRFGLPIAARGTFQIEGDFIEVFPLDLDRNEGFTVKAVRGWRSFTVEFLPGTFSATLLLEMGRARPDKRQIFKSIAALCINLGEDLSLTVNNRAYNPIEDNDWPKEWKNVHLLLKKSPVSIDESNTENLEKEVYSSFGRVFAMILSLIPVDATSEAEQHLGLPEGAIQRIEVNRYERNRLNRIASIEAHGTVCQVCGFDFESVYGEIGVGFIHVHHVTPVSQIKERRYVIDPVKDLVPVCPNCHAMLHRKDPPYTVEQMKGILSLKT